jgi:hypothetical protein
VASTTVVSRSSAWPWGQPRDRVRAGWRDEHALGPAGQFDVAHRGLALLVPQAYAYRLPGQGLERGRRDEVRGAFGHHHAHLGLEVAQAADEFADLVRGDAAGDADQDATLTKTHGETARRRGAS